MTDDRGLAALAAALIESDLIRRYSEYALAAAPETMRATSIYELARLWAPRILGERGVFTVDGTAFAAGIAEIAKAEEEQRATIATLRAASEDCSGSPAHFGGCGCLCHVYHPATPATPAPLDGPRSMESVRSWLGLDLWQGLGHDFEHWTGWTADAWAQMIAEVRAIAAAYDKEPDHA